MASEGILSKISGPVVQATGMQGAQINELVKVGDMQLVGEIIALKYDRASIQVYEDTTGLRPGERVVRTGAPLSVELAPGLLSGIFDGTQRPLEAIMQKAGNYITKGISVNSLDRKKKWDFEPAAKKGEKVKPGDVLGSVKENEIEHRIMVPAGVEGTVTEIEKGSFTITETIAVVGNTNVCMLQQWPVRVPRKYADKLRIDQPLITGKRIVDTFFPIAKGGVAAIPGPFGSGKCVSGKTPVFLADGSLKTMKELYEYCKKNGEVTETVFEETIQLHEPLEIFSFDGRKIRVAESRIFYKGKSDSLLSIRTRSGKVLEVTPVHKLFKVTPELQIRETPAQELNPGEFIAGVRKLPITFGSPLECNDYEKPLKDDVVPASSKLIELAFDKAGRPYAPLRQNGIEITNYTKKGGLMSADAFKCFASTLTETAAGKQKQVQWSRMAQFAEALNWIHCDEIVSIEELEGPHDVYDISVPGTENWVGGNAPMLFHNTVTQQDLAKYADADVIVYIGCGERGNEMTDVLVEFPKLLDPKNKKPLMNRTVLIANTSNMPVAAREASIYTGITIAEYYRDMGYSVALMADSTSRWAEAMREISGRMEEMPGEEGYPAYLAKKLAEFYERAGTVQCMASKPRYGSISVIGAVSPPGGDISEPVSQATLRVTKVFWALDANLSRRRHYPAINWLKSYSLYLDDLEKWYLDNVASDFYDARSRAMTLLQEEAELQNIVQLIGPDALPDKQRLVLEATKMIREDFLQQNSYDEIDVYSTLKKQHALLKVILQFYDKASNALAVDVPFEKIQKAPQKQAIAGLKRLKDEEFGKAVGELQKSLETAFAKG